MNIFFVWNTILVFSCLLIFWNPKKMGFQLGNIQTEGKTIFKVSFTVMFVFLVGAFIVLNFVLKGNPYRDSDFEPVIMSPILEETFFRGALFYLISRGIDKLGIIKHKPVIIILINAILFGCVHFINVFDSDMNLTFICIQVAVNTALGAFFTYIRYKSDSIYTSMFVHFLWNFINTKI